MADTVVVRDTIIVRDTTANPAPLGLFGFGMTTILLNLHNAGLYPMNMMILAMGLAFGGAAQIIAGCMEWKKNNTFGTTAFTSYGFFWWSLVGIVLMPKIDATMAVDPTAFGWYLTVWGLFTFGLFIGTFRLSGALVVVFGSLTLLFFLLAGEKFNTMSPAYAKFTGYEGVFCGASACYTGLAAVLNEVYGRTVLPIVPLGKK